MLHESYSTAVPFLPGRRGGAPAPERQRGPPAVVAFLVSLLLPGLREDLTSSPLAAAGAACAGIGARRHLPALCRPQSTAYSQSGCNSELEQLLVAASGYSRLPVSGVPHAVLLHPAASEFPRVMRTAEFAADFGASPVDNGKQSRIGCRAANRIATETRANGHSIDTQ